ncbi:hypothetical protein [Brevibacillus sp. 179-C9.3 HS]|uniref:hypothetical protein n=1 Tax=unclassified Brevibacillus TaxID=2684853 RepID=UPI0039A3099F
MMKRMGWTLAIGIALMMAQSTAFLVHASEVNTSNRYQVAGITNPKAFEAFFVKLQEAVKKNDQTEVAKQMRYPLRVNKDGKSLFIKDEKQFLADYDQIITEKVKEAFLHQKVNDTFVNDQGVMVGNGEMWLGQFLDRFAVFAINVD